MNNAKPATGVVLLMLVVALMFGTMRCAPPNRQAAETAAAAQPPAPPPAADAQHAANADNTNNNNNEQAQESLYKFPYSKYLELVVKILESQPKFQERIRQLGEADIKTGKIADQIDDLGHDVFEQLTKAKLEEINRLRDDFERQIKAEGGAQNIKMPEHLDIDDLQKFGKEDLRKLIIKTVADMNDIDTKRKEEFKEYEMRKKAEEEHRLAQLPADERARVKAAADEAQARHNKHDPIKHPGGREQLEEVWEERDQMDKESYDAKTFFALHDLNGDGMWNEEELEALFQLELEKIYNETNPDDDPKEKIEEMYQMREHVVKQMDKNNDRMISLQEFLQDPEAQVDDKKDEGWQDLGQKAVYTDEELKKFEEEYARQKGWGEHAYDGAQTLPPAHTPQQQQQYNQQQQLSQQQQQYQQPPQQQQYQQQPIQPIVNDQQQQQLNQQYQQPQQQQQPEQKLKKIDPVYGV